MYNVLVILDNRGASARDGEGVGPVHRDLAMRFKITPEDRVHTGTVICGLRSHAVRDRPQGLFVRAGYANQG